MNQTYSNLECIVVDDSTFDNTSEINRYLKNDQIIYIRHDENKGASAARNTGINNSKGDFIAFLDDDDEWLPKKLEKQVKLLQCSSSKVGLVYCWANYFNNDGEYLNHAPNLKGNIFKDVLDKQPIGNSSTILIRKEVISEIGLFDISLPRGNDGDFIRRICKNYEVDFIPKFLVKVHTNDDIPRISDDTVESIENIIKSLKVRFVKFSDEKYIYPKEFASICLYIAYHYSRINKINHSIIWSIKAISFSPFSLFVYFRILNLFKHSSTSEK